MKAVIVGFETVGRTDTATRVQLRASGRPRIWAAAIVAAFHGFVRLADATGIPYEGAALGTDSAELRAEIGVETFYAASLGDRD